MGRFRITLRLTLVLALLGSALCVVSSPGIRPGRAAVFQAGAEYVRTYAGDCVTPQTVFYLGDTVCAEAGTFPLPLTSRFRRFQWSAPDTTVADLSSIRIDPQQDRFLIPTSGALAQTGTWYVRTINASSEGHAAARFIVRHQFARLADLWIVVNGPQIVLPEERVLFRLGVGNPGPDPGELVQFSSDVPSNMVFVGLKQVSGPFFECSTPPRGEGGKIVCQGKGLDLEETAEFDIYYQVDPRATKGMTCTGASFVSSHTEETNKADNEWNVEVLVGGDDPPDPGEQEP